MKNPLTSMLYPIILLIAKEVLSVGTVAFIEVIVVISGTTARTIHFKLKGTIHPGKAVIKNQYVITAWVHIT